MSNNSHTARFPDSSTIGRDMTSEVYELITRDDVRFFVHSDILASQSKCFQQTITKTLKESSERKIHLTNWDAETVARLVEFLYRDDYPYPDPSPVEPRPRTTPEPRQPNAVNVNAQPGSSQLFSLSGGPPVPNRADKIGDGQRLEPFDPAKFDYGRVLMAHARVYVLASNKAIGSLQIFAFKRLLLALVRLQPLQAGSHIASNIAGLAGYVYENTNHISEYQLRMFVARFIALNIVAFQKDPLAVMLMAKGGSLVTDIMSELCKGLEGSTTTSPTATPPKTRYISNIKMVCGARRPDRVQEVHGLSCNINSPSSEPHNIWLIREYTEIADDACTRFTISRSDETNPRPSLGLSWDKTECAKVTEVALIRSSSNFGLDIETVKQYDGMSDNINYNMRINPMYLLWKTVKTGKV